MKTYIDKASLYNSIAELEATARKNYLAVLSSGNPLKEMCAYERFCTLTKIKFLVGDFPDEVF